MYESIFLDVGEEKFKLSFKLYDNVCQTKQFRTLWELNDFINNNTLMEMTIWHEWDNGSGLYNTRMMNNDNN